MNRIISFLFGSCEITISGAAPERCINALAEEKIAIWKILFIDDMHDSFSVLSKDRKKVEQIAIRNYCTVEHCCQTGVPSLLKKLLSRPVLLISMLLALVMSFFLQSFVWVIEVDGNETVPTDVIVRELENQNIKFGAWAGSIDSQATKNRMLNAVPSLSWLAVNRSGGKLTVLVTERESGISEEAPYDTANIVAAKDGVITDYSISEGMKLCARGDTVKKGQILVSGYEDYGLFIRNVCAEAEIYAKTWYTGTVVTPAVKMQKVYTGRTEKQVSLILERKRIKLSGNSSISEGTCDKMVVTRRLSLPGYTFPAAIETVIIREYTLKAVPMLPAAAQEKLREAWKRQTLSSMIAGTIDNTAEHFAANHNLYILQAQSTCTEMIAKPVPLNGPGKGETNE